MTAPPAAPAGPAPVYLALALSLGAAVSLGITRFAYGLLLPVMKDDLAWSYTLAGAMNTVNAAGYLLGALVTPWLLRRWGAAPGVGALAVVLGHQCVGDAARRAVARERRHDDAAGQGERAQAQGGKQRVGHRRILG